MKQTDYNKNIGSLTQPWVQWKHISMGKTHCPTCLKLHKCWFAKANMPQLPQHPFCHCTAVPKSSLAVRAQSKATSPQAKFTEYLFNPENPENKGKVALFEAWGYHKEDSAWMMAEYERQAKEKYTSGEYSLGDIDEHGQRINIQIAIPRKEGAGEITYRTGWLVEANGRIRLITPYGGKR